MSGPRVLVVDWLGRGGIAHTSQAWLAVLSGAGAEVHLVTRGGRELARAYPSAVTAGASTSLGAHVRVVRAAARTADEVRPDVVVFQGAVLPRLELAAIAAARRAGARVVQVVHEVRPARRLVGSGTVADLARRADLVVVHSRAVAGALGPLPAGVACRLVPLPLPVGVLQRLPEGRALVDPSEPLALHFGHLGRGYKGTATVVDLARQGVAGWSFALVGTGGPRHASGAAVVRGFASAGDLAATVAASSATLLPYRAAAQSGAVVLAQALGSVVVASAVGGIPEQVADGVTGLLVDPQAPLAQWSEALSRLSDAGLRASIAASAKHVACQRHDEFCAAVADVVSQS